jgi:hypothetical protein
MPKWRFWERGEKETQVSTSERGPISSLSRLEKQGILSIITTDILEARVKNLHDGLLKCLEDYREASYCEFIPEELVEQLSKEEREEYARKRIQAIKDKRKALDQAVVLLTDVAWPWNRGGDKKHRLSAFIVDEFLQEYEEYKDVPEEFDTLFTELLSIAQKSYKEPDVTKEVPIAIFSPSPGHQVDLRKAEEL